MHSSLSIYHRDIKPDNIVYSMRLKRLVLIDFGLSVCCPKSYRGRQFTGYCGTLRYMSEEMKRVKEDDGGEGYVDLARCDMQALQKSIEVIKERNGQGSETVDFEEEYNKAGRGLEWKEFE